MARRAIFDKEPVSKLAAWSGRLGVFAFAVAALSVLILRSGMLEIVPALATFAAALAFAGLAILFALGSFITIWRQGLSGLGYALLGMLLGFALLAYPGYLGYRGLKLPAITDVTTDPANPPRFDVLARLRPRGRVDYPSAFAEKQRAAYPDIVPLQLTVPAKAAYDAAMAIMTKRKWLIVDTRAPSATRRDGSIEAVARTPIMGFRDDIAIRITPLRDGTRVDARSASRVGTHDFGANAARLRVFLEELDDQAGSAPEPRAEEPAKPEPKRPQPANKRN